MVHDHTAVGRSLLTLAVVSITSTIPVSGSRNERDQAVVISASGILDGSAAAFLPNMRDGEALLVGSDSIIPLPIMIKPPSQRPFLPENTATTWLNALV
jgi:hypothetical protein